MSDFITALLRIVTFGIYQGKQAKAEKDAKDRAEAEAINREVHQPVEGERRDPR